MARSALKRDMMPHTVRRDAGSMPAVGSSSSTNLGSPISAHASESLRFCPPDSVSARAPNLSSASPTARSMRAGSSPASAASSMPLTDPTSRRLSRQVSAAKTRSCCGQTPESARTPSICVATSLPKATASPSDCGKRPVRMPMVVVLPAPFCPSSAVICPS